MKNRVLFKAHWVALLLLVCFVTLHAGEKFFPDPAPADIRFIHFWSAGIPMSEWKTFVYGSVTGNSAGTVGEMDSEGAVPIPFVPAEAFLPNANEPVSLAAVVGENVRMNDLTLCTGGRGIVQSETSIAAYGDVIVAAWNDSRGFFCTGRSTLGWAFSYDGGQTFFDGGSLPGGRTPWSNGDPALGVGPDGTFYIAGIASNFTGMSVSKGTIDKGGISWSAPVRAVSGSNSDKEFLAVDPVYGYLYMGLSRAQQIEVVSSYDGGDSWSSPVRLQSTGIGAFPLVDYNSKVYVAWLFGWPSANQNIRFASSEDFGASFSPPIIVSRVCPVTVPGFSRGQMPAFPTVAIDQSGGKYTGRLYVAWHSNCSGNAEALLSYSDDGGFSWSDPVVVNDDATTAIQFSPSVSVDVYGYVNVVFYDRRNNPGTALTNVYYAQSYDGGVTFSENVRISDVTSNWTTSSDITPNMGDYLQAISHGGEVLVSWSDSRRGNPDAFFARINPFGKVRK